MRRRRQGHGRSAGNICRQRNQSRRNSHGDEASAKGKIGRSARPRTSDWARVAAYPVLCDIRHQSIAPSQPASFAVIRAVSKRSRPLAFPQWPGSPASPASAAHESAAPQPTSLARDPAVQALRREDMRRAGLVRYCVATTPQENTKSTWPIRERWCERLGRMPFTLDAPEVRMKGRSSPARSQ